MIIVPAYADVWVDTLSLEKSSYTNYEIIKFAGTTEGDDRSKVSIIIRNSEGELVAIISDPISDKNGEYIAISLVNNVFTETGKYTATAVTSQQREQSGVTISLEYDGTKINQIKKTIPILNSITDKEITVGGKLSFSVSLTDSTIKKVTYSITKNAPINATINSETGEFVWIPNKSYGDSKVVFDIIATTDDQEVREEVQITIHNVAEVEGVAEVEVEGVAEVEVEGVAEVEGVVEVKIAPFVDSNFDPQYYVDRYHKEGEYKLWFEINFPEYSSIYEAVGLEEPPRFVDPHMNPQHYVDRYYNEVIYRDWFDKNYPDSTIYEVVGLEEPTLITFIDTSIDPQYYIDRYNTEIEYKKWFDETYPEITIHDAINIVNTSVTKSKNMQCSQGTVLVNGNCEIENATKEGGCLIATATFGSELAPQVQQLREIRDNIILETDSGKAFMKTFNQFYYLFSPTVADFEREQPIFKEMMKITLTPMISSLSILNYVDIDSEHEILTYGISMILLNIGMYVGIPGTVIYKITKINSRKQMTKRFRKIPKII